MQTRLRTWFVMVLFSLAGVVCHAAPPEIAFADWRPRKDVFLVEGAEPISEQDFYLFCLMARQLTAEDARRWESLEPARKERVRSILRTYVETMAYLREAPEPTTGPEIDLARRAARIYAGPVARLIWADTLVRNSLRLFPEDLLYAYRNSGKKYMTPASVLVRRLRVPFKDDGVEASRAARQRGSELRELAQRGGGLGPILEANPDLLLDPPGRTAELLAGDSTTDPLLLDAALGLPVGQISQPILTRGGVFLVEVVERREPRALPLQEVRADLEATLRSQFLPQQYDYLAGLAIQRSFATNRARLFQFMPGDAAIVSVRDFDLTLDEFKRLFPEVIGNPQRPNKPAIAGRVADIVAGEVLTQEIERVGLSFEALYQDALVLGDKLHRASDHIRTQRAALAPTEKEVLAFLESRREEIAPTKAKTLWRFEISVRNPDGLSRGELDAVRILMQAYLRDLIRQAEQQLTERRKAVEAVGGTVDPSATLRNLPEPPDTRVRSSFEKIGTFNKPRVERELGVAWDDLRLGQFTRPLPLRDTSVVSYYVEDVSETTPTPDDVQFDAARAALLIELSSARVRDVTQQRFQSGELRFHKALSSP